MTEKEIIKAAVYAEEKGLSYEDLSYHSDYSEYADEIYDYVIEMRDFGIIAFEENYKGYLK